MPFSSRQLSTGRQSMRAQTLRWVWCVAGYTLVKIIQRMPIIQHEMTQMRQMIAVISICCQS